MLNSQTSIADVVSVYIYRIGSIEQNKNICGTLENLLHRQNDICHCEKCNNKMFCLNNGKINEIICNCEINLCTSLYGIKKGWTLEIYSTSENCTTVPFLMQATHFGVIRIISADEKAVSRTKNKKFNLNDRLSVSATN